MLSATERLELLYLASAAGDIEMCSHAHLDLIQEALWWTHEHVQHRVLLQDSQG